MEGTGTMRTTTAVLAGLALLLTGCASDDDGPGQTEPEPTTTPTVTASPTAPTSPDEPGEAGDVSQLRFATCEADAYTVGYPEEWNTNDTNELLGPCNIFHPGDIELPEQPRDRDLHWAVSLYVDEVGFDDRLAADNPNEVLEEREAEVDGRRAHVVEYRSTGEALTPEGERSYTWAVDLDGRILVATTSSVGDTDYERDKAVLDRMVTEELSVHDAVARIDGPATTDESTEEPDGGPLVVTDVRVGGHDGFDRITFEIAGDGAAGWRIAYEDEPRSQGSGNPVEVAGDAVLRITLRDMAYPEDAPAEPYDGPERIEPAGTDAIVEVLEDTLYEGHHDFFVGLDAERPYRVERLDDPQRVVVDIETG